MVKIPSALPLPGDEAIIIGKKYLITKVEVFKSDVQGFVGARVVLSVGGKEVAALALWEREVVSEKSKLGTFIANLSDETENWTGKTIQFESWTARNRAIKVVQPEAPKK